MAIRRGPIFRERAMKHYLRRGEKDVLPHLITPSVFLLLWLLLVLLLTAMVVLLPRLHGLIGG